MAKFKFKIDGVIEWLSKEEIILKPGEKYHLKAIIEGDGGKSTNMELKDIELQRKEIEKPQLTKERTAVTVAPVTLAACNEVESKSWTSSHMTLEQFGGIGYYKLIESGLIYKGDLVESNVPIFSNDDLGKTFCGLFAHQNPLQPEKDNYFPGVQGSRYALIIEVLDSKRIKLNFEFNSQSDKGYIFFDNSLAFRSALNAVKNSDSNVLELQSGKTYVVPEYSGIDLGGDLYLMSKSNSNLKLGIEDYFQWAEEKSKNQSGHLFNIGGNSVTVGIYNVNFLPPHRRISCAQLFFTSMFKSTPNKNQKARIAVINMDSTKEVNNKDPRYNQFGFGFGFLYSSEVGNVVVGKNIKHRGPGFMDFKANFGGGLYAVFENVETSFENEEAFASPKVKVKGKLQNNIFTITSGHTIYQIYTYDFGVGNVAHLLHFGRYTFIIDGKAAVISATEFRVRPFVDQTTTLKVRDIQSVYSKKVELHAGDILKLNGESFTIVEKTRTYVTEWMEGDKDTQYAMCLKLDKELPVASGFLDFEVASVGRSLNDGKEVDAYLIYKANTEFRTYPHSKFEDREVLSSDPVGHLSYNHKEITLWAKNFKHKGFYRQSLSRVGKSNGYTLIDCEGFDGQFGPDDPIKNSGEMPEEAKRLIEMVEVKNG